MIEFISSCISPIDTSSLPLIVQVLQIAARCCAFGDAIRRMATYVKCRRSLPESRRTAENPGGSLEPKTRKLARSKAQFNWKDNVGRAAKQLFRLIHLYDWLIHELNGGDILHDSIASIVGWIGY